MGISRSLWIIGELKPKELPHFFWKFLILFSLSSYYSFLINCTDILSIFLFHNKNTNFLHNMYFCLHKNEEGFKNPLNCFHDIYLFNFGKSSYFKMSIFYFSAQNATSSYTLNCSGSATSFIVQNFMLGNSCNEKKQNKSSSSFVYSSSIILPETFCNV